jgi:ABC-type proline/glycine betaine transport system ATPase subunit
LNTGASPISFSGPGKSFSHRATFLRLSRITAVSDGTIIIRDQDKQTQDVNDLSRDVEHANQTLSPIFDKVKVVKK